MFRELICALTGVGLLAGIAHANDRELARREFDAGESADREHDYQTAIEHYLRANSQLPHPFTIFNIATDYERLGDMREAARWYRRYLEVAKHSPDEPRIRRKLAELDAIVAAEPAPSASAPTTPGSTLELGLIGGLAAHVDAASGNQQIALEVGGRLDRFELLFEVGHLSALKTSSAAGATLLGLTARALLTRGRLAPFVAIAASWIDSDGSTGRGFGAAAGARYALTRSHGITITGLATLGVTYYSTPDPVFPMETEVVVPIELSIEATFE